MFGIFLLSSAINKLLISPVSSAAAERERREGDFRARHLALWAEAEAVAFSDAKKASGTNSLHLKHVTGFTGLVATHNLLHTISF